jgi:hypothetical protein
MTDDGREEPLVFHYSREERLSSADEAVRELNEARQRRRPGLFRTLTATRPLAFLFLAIIMLSLTALVTNFLVPSPDEAELGGNRFSLSAFRFEGDVYVAVKKTKARRDAYIGPAVLRISASMDGSADFSAELSITTATSQEFKYRLQAGGDRIAASLEMNGRAVLLKATAR